MHPLKRLEKGRYSQGFVVVEMKKENMLILLLLVINSNAQLVSEVSHNNIETINEINYFVLSQEESIDSI